MVLAWDFDESAGFAGFNVYRMNVEETESPEALHRRLAERGGFSVAEALAERAGLGSTGAGRGGGFIKLNGELVQGGSFTDAGAVDGVLYSYMVGAVGDDGTEVLAGPVEVLADFRVSGLWLAPPTPNPFAGTSSFEFAVPRGAGAELGIYTPGGRVVRRLDIAAGSSAATWDGLSSRGEPVSPGVYLVKLEAAGESAHRKLVFLR